MERSAKMKAKITANRKGQGVHAGLEVIISSHFSKGDFVVELVARPSASEDRSVSCCIDGATSVISTLSTGFEWALDDMAGV